MIWSSTMQNRTKIGVYDDEPVPAPFALRARELYVLDDSPIVTLHYHDTTELGYCHDGVGVFVVGGRILSFAAGDVSIVGPGVMHLAQSLQGTRSTWSFVFLDVNGLLLPSFPELASLDITSITAGASLNIVSARKDKDLNESVRALIGEMRHRKRLYRTAVISHLALVITRLSRSSPPAGVGPTAYDVGKSLRPFKSALELIARNYHRKISIGELARLSGMSERTVGDNRSGNAARWSSEEGASAVRRLRSSQPATASR